MLSALLCLAATTSSAQGPSATFLPSAPPEQCTRAPAGTRTAAEWLATAAQRVLPHSAGKQVLRYRASHDVPFWEQSDRMYEPFIANVQQTVRWFDLTTGVEARHPTQRPVAHTQYPSQLMTTSASYAGRDTTVQPVEGMHKFTTAMRRLNPWMVLMDWRQHAEDVRVVERCVFREFPRIVLARGNERLYLGEVDGVPVKLERIEPHYLWGQVKAAYLWMTWWGVKGGGLYPVSAVRQFDGTTYDRVGMESGSAEMIDADSAPRLTVPAVAPMNETLLLTSLPTDTVRLSASTYLLRTPAYTETVTLARDTVFLLDATSGEARAREDSAWIATLYPGRHPVVVVVTDLAWPHISGVRFWVARGATIVTHRASADFLRRVVNRRWTLEPDALEKSRATARLVLRLVDDSLRLGGGAVRVHAMLGNTTEGALAVWLPTDRFLWAGDYLQRDPASPYVVDVVRTARRLGLDPERVAAQHMPPLAWADVLKRVPPE